MTCKTENRTSLALWGKDLPSPAPGCGSLRGGYPQRSLSGKTRPSQRGMKALCPGAGGTKEGSTRNLLSWPLLFTPLSSSPGAFLVVCCPVSRAKGDGGQSRPLSPYCYLRLVGQAKWNPVWLRALCLTWPWWSVETYARVIHVLTSSSYPQRSRREGHTWVRMSSAATIQSESPNQEPHTGSHLPCLVDSWRPPWGACQLQPASCREAGSQRIVAWRGCCSICWSWVEGFWNVPGPGVQSAQRLSSHDASSVISSEDALSWGGLLGDGYSTASRSVFAKPTSFSFIFPSLDTWQTSVSGRQSFFSCSHSRWSRLPLLCQWQWVCWGLLLPDKALGTRGRWVRV